MSRVESSRVVVISLCFSVEGEAWGNNGESRGVACKIRIFGALGL